jgi:hypothetical protein
MKSHVRLISEQDQPASPLLSGAMRIFVSVIARIMGKLVNAAVF